MKHFAYLLAQDLKNDPELAKEFVRYAHMTDTKKCPDCDGDGYTTCCGIGVTEPGWPDSDFCAGCYEHSAESCDTCNGKGEIKS